MAQAKDLDYDFDTATLTNSYWLTAFGTEQGSKALTVSGDTGVTVDFGTLGTPYGTSGITAYPTGIQYGSHFYAGEEEIVSLGLSCSAEDASAVSYTANAGTLAVAGNGWTLKLPGGDVIIRAVEVSDFGEPDFRLPAGLTQIGKEAFKGAKMHVVLVPENCTDIGEYAFRECANLTQIRIPKDCTLETDVFYDCGMVCVYGEAGSSAEEYCNSHGNCVFVQME